MSSIPMEKVAEAVKKALEGSGKKGFTQSLELIINLRDVDPKLPENRFSELIPLPNTSARWVRKVCFIADGEMAFKAKEAGADLVLSREDLEKISSDKKNVKKIAKDYDFLVAKDQLMPLIGRYLGQTLGPRGKMPDPVPSTVDVKSLIARYRQSIRIRMKDQPVIRCKVGVEDMSLKDLAENIQAVVAAVRRRVKSPYNIGSIYVKTTMGKPVKLTG